VIVDSSKAHEHARVMALTPGLQVTILHLIRDFRGVAYSIKSRMEARKRNWQVIRLVREGMSWRRINAIGERYVLQLGGMSLRYEDFCECPDEEFSRLVRMMDRQPTLDLSGGVATFGTNHVVMGNNPQRFLRGEVAISRDDRWIDGLTRSSRSLATIATYPFMRRYGYL
jgi:hypothetical protein